MNCFFGRQNATFKTLETWLVHKIYCNKKLYRTTFTVSYITGRIKLLVSYKNTCTNSALKQSIYFYTTAYKLPIFEYYKLFYRRFPCLKSQPSLGCSWSHLYTSIGEKRKPMPLRNVELHLCMRNAQITQSSRKMDR